MSTKILILGKNGQVGFELQRSLGIVGSVTALGRSECDMSVEAEIVEAVEKYQPDIIVNASAYTAVDKAETETELAMVVNGAALKTLSVLAEKANALLIHYSTDYVYPGTKEGLHLESDKANPQSEYGRTKLAGEDAIRSTSVKHLIFRTSWVYGTYGGNFVKTMLRLMKERPALRVVADQFGAPTNAALIADVTSNIVAVYSKRPLKENFPFGTYHLVASGETSWHGFAQFISETASDLGANLMAGPDAIEPITTEEYPLPATRPKNSRLSTVKLQENFHLNLPDWREGVRHTLQQLICK